MDMGKDGVASFRDAEQTQCRTMLWMARLRDFDLLEDVLLETSPEGEHLPMVSSLSRM
jgi:hypothetical protein